MAPISYFTAALALVSTVAAAPSAGHQNPRRNGPAKAVYFMTNQGDGNAVVALKVGRDGSLSDGSVTSTGGKGMSGITAATGMTQGGDGTFSQGALETVGDMLAVVNPGSNTLSLLRIDARDATKLKLVGKPADTMGDFPTSVALSEKLRTACVLNGGSRAGIACFSMDSKRGLLPLDKSLRRFDLKQTNPPAGPPNTVSQTFFNADSSVLLTTVKGDGMGAASKQPGFLSIFPVKGGKVSMEGSHSTPNGTTTLFGSANIGGDKDLIFSADPGFGGVTLKISDSHRGQASAVAVQARTDIAGQKATCWATYSDHTNTVFVGDAAQNRLVEIDPASGDIVGELSPANDNPGMIDLEAAGDFLYALSPGTPPQIKSAVAVFDISRKGKARAVQNFESALFNGVTAQGLTVKV